MADEHGLLTSLMEPRVSAKLLHRHQEALVLLVLHVLAGYTMHSHTRPHPLDKSRHPNTILFAPTGRLETPLLQNWPFPSQFCLSGCLCTHWWSLADVDNLRGLENLLNKVTAHLGEVDHQDEHGHLHRISRDWKPISLIFHLARRPRASLQVTEYMPHGSKGLLSGTQSTTMGALILQLGPYNVLPSSHQPAAGDGARATGGGCRQLSHAPSSKETRIHSTILQKTMRWR